MAQLYILVVRNVHVVIREPIHKAVVLVKRLPLVVRCGAKDATVIITEPKERKVKTD